MASQHPRHGTLTPAQILCLQQLKPLLVKRLDGRAVVDALYTAGIFDLNDKNTLSEIFHDEDLNRGLVDKLTMRTPAGFDAFVKVLSETGHADAAEQIHQKMSELKRAAGKAVPHGDHVPDHGRYSSSDIHVSVPQSRSSIHLLESGHLAELEKRQARIEELELKLKDAEEDSRRKTRELEELKKSRPKERDRDNVKKEMDELRKVRDQLVEKEKLLQSAEKENQKMAKELAQVREELSKLQTECQALKDQHQSTPNTKKSGTCVIM